MTEPLYISAIVNTVARTPVTNSFRCCWALGNHSEVKDASSPSCIPGIPTLEPSSQAGMIYGSFRSCCVPTALS